MNTNGRMTISLRKGLLFELIIMAILIILVGGNVGTHDYISFYNSYTKILNPAFEQGYKLFENFCYTNGVAYNTFRILICAINVLVSYRISRKFDISSALFLILYFIYPLPHDGAYLRNTLAKCIVYYSFLVAMDKRLISKVFSILLIIVAMQFHSISCIYLAPLVAWIFVQTDSKHMRKFILGVILANVICVAVIAAIYRPLLVWIVNFISSMSFFAGNKQIYLAISGNYGFILMGGIQALFAVLLFLCVLQFKESKEMQTNWGLTDKRKNEMAYVFTRLVLLTCVVLLPMTALYKVNSNYFRVFRNMVPLIYIALLSCLKITKGINIRRERLIKFFFAGLLVICVVVDIMGSKYELWDSMFTNNWIL